MSTPQLVIFSQTFNIHHIPLIKPHLGTLDGERGGGGGGQGTCDGLSVFEWDRAVRNV